MDSDLVLLRRFARCRDEEAFREIYQRHAGLVLGTCRRVLGDAARGEEIAQETFFRLMRKPEAVTRSLTGWLHRTATDLAIDALRSDSSRRRREASYASIQHQEASTWQELEPFVDEALDELPEELSVLLVEHFLRGRTQHELAVEHKTSTATMCRRIKEGLDALGARLRSKGVVVGGAALVVLMGSHAAEAATPALMASLGKMAMVSGPSMAGRGAAASVSGKQMALVCIGSVGFVGVLAVVVAGLYLSGGNGGAVRISDTASGPRIAASAVGAQNVTSSGADAEERTKFVAVRVGAGDLGSQTITLFERPTGEEGQRVAVAHGDGHVQTMTVQELEERIRNQTGMTVEELIRASEQAP